MYIHTHKYSHIRLLRLVKSLFLNLTSLYFLFSNALIVYLLMFIKLIPHNNIKL